MKNGRLKISEVLPVPRLVPAWHEQSPLLIIRVGIFVNEQERAAGPEVLHLNIFSTG